MPIVKSDPTKWGLAATAQELLNKRTRHAKHFQNADGTHTAVLINNLHYDSPQGWDDVDLSWKSAGAGTWGVTRHDIHYAAHATGLDLTEAASGKGIRWLLPGISGVGQHQFNWTHAGTGLSWNYTNQVAGIKATAVVTSKLGKKTIVLPYTLLGGAAPLTVDAGGNLASDVFAVPRAVAYGADGKTYPLGAWTLTSLAGNAAVQFAYDDSSIPAGAFPVKVDPTTTFANTLTADQGYTSASSATYPPAGPGTFSNNGTDFFVERDLFSLTYYIGISAFRWDTSSLGVGVTVSSANVILFVSNVSNTGNEGRSVVAEWFNNSAWPLTASSLYTSTPSNTALAGQAVSGLIKNTQYIWALQAVNNVNPTGYTPLRFHMSGGQPAVSGGQWAAISSFADATVANRPQLQVTYTTPDAMISAPRANVGALARPATVTTQQTATINAPRASITAQARAAIVIAGTGTTVSAPRANVTAQARPAAIVVGTGVIVQAPRASATASARTATITVTRGAVVASRPAFVTATPRGASVVALTKPTLLATLQSRIRQEKTYVQFLNSDGTLNGEPVFADLVDGSVSLNYPQMSRRSADVRLQNKSTLYLPNGPKVGINNQLRIVKRLWDANASMSSSNYTDFPLFTGLLGNPTAISYPGQTEVKLIGLDKMWRFTKQGGGVLTGGGYQINAGDNVQTHIKTLTGQFGETLFRMDQCTDTMPYSVTFNEGTEVLTVLSALTAVNTWELFYDSWGYLVHRQRAEPTTAPVLWNYSATPPGGNVANLYAGSERTLEWQQMRNDIVVVGWSPLTITVRSEQFDNNPSSPTYVGATKQFARYDYLHVNEIATQANADARAKWELKKGISVNEHIKARLVPNYLHIEGGDIVMFTDPNNGANGRYEIQQLRIPVGYGQWMDATVWAARSFTTPGG